jgi:hypothetical protein
VTVGRDGQIYVTTDNGAARGDQGPSHVFAYDSGGHRTADVAVTGQPNGHVHGLTGAAVDVDGRSVVALEPDAARVIAVDLSAGTQRAVATVPDLPACLVALGSPTCQPGVDDRNPLPIAAAFDRVGNLFITDPLQDTVWRLRPGANVAEVWYQSNFFTLGDGPYGLAVHDNVVDFTVGTTLDPAARGGGGLYRVAVNADGTAGTPTLVSLFGRGDEPGPLAVGGTGTAYVVLRGSGTLVAIAPTGSEAWRIAPPGSGAIPLDAPSALALIGGRLLVTNAGTGTDPSHWAVLSVAVMDGPAQ